MTVNSRIFFLVVAAQFWLACGRAADPPSQAVFRYVADNSRWVAVCHGESCSLGRLDAAGNFIPDRRWLNQTGGFSACPPSDLINSPALSHVYEYRSGRLIPGRLDNDGNFIPRLNGGIIAFKDYHYGKGASLIWNLPGYFVNDKGERATRIPPH